MPPAAKRNPLALELWAELQAGDVYEADLREPRYHLDGLCDGGRVYVNPAPAVVETLLHELIHRARPGWGERRVLLESRRLVGKMTEREVRKWYRAYQRIAVRRVKPVQVNE